MSKSISNCRLCTSNNIELICILEGVPSGAQIFLTQNNKITDESIDLYIGQCKSCGHVQSLSEEVTYFKDVITTASTSKTLMEERLLKINDILKRSKFNQVNILEIGSGKGDMVKTIKERLDFHITGLENSSQSVEIAKSQGINLIQGYITDENLELPSRNYNLILCYNFLEHSPQPAQFVNSLKNYITDSARIYFTVPSFDYILRTSCIHEFISDHTSYFTKESLSKLFSGLGFNVLEVNHINDNNDLEIQAEYVHPSLFRLDHSPYNQLIQELNYILTTNKKVIFWGAGHRALTLISQLDYKNIHSIVDSAKFKQGLYSPVSSKAIISPQEFVDKHLDSTLIVNLPGIYNSEVINFLRSCNTSSLNIFAVSDNLVEAVDFKHC